MLICLSRAVLRVGYSRALHRGRAALRLQTPYCSEIFSMRFRGSNWLVLTAVMLYIGVGFGAQQIT